MIIDERTSKAVSQFAYVPRGQCPSWVLCLHVCSSIYAFSQLPPSRSPSLPLPSIFLNNRKNSSNPNLLQQWTEKRYYTGAIEHNSCGASSGNKQLYFLFFNNVPKNKNVSLSHDLTDSILFFPINE